MKHIKKIFPLLSLFFLNAAVFALPYYFENPSAFSSTSNSYFPKTISNAEGADKCLVFYEEAEPQKNELALYVRKSSDGYNWEEKKLIADKISYQFSVPNIFSCAYSGGIYALAFLKNESTISVITSKDAFETFKEHEIKNVTSTRVAPRIFANGKEGFILFVSEAKGEDFLIKYSLSKDGASWADFLAIDTSTLSNVGNPLVPYYAAGKNSSILLFIAQYHKSGLISLQIFSTVSKTNGRTWEKINLLTDEKIADNNKFDNYSNQSPYLFYDGKNFNLVWERSSSSFLNPDIYYAVLDENAKIKGGAEKVSTSGFSNHPTLFMYKEKLHLLWFVNQSGNKKVYLSHKDGMLWSEPESLSTSSCVYPSFILNGKDNGLSFVWQKEFLASKTSSVEILRSDHSVKPPKIMGSNFKNKDRGALSNISAVISPEDDSSGIKGLSWIFTSDEKEEPPLEISAKPVTEKISAEITKDGVHYFKVKQTDFAGNWSDTVSICYESDKTPPLGVKANDLLLDVSETLVSNTFKITWTPDSRDDDIAGYSYMLKKIDDIPPPLVSNKYHPMRITEDEALDLRNELVTKNEAALDEDVHLSAKIITKNPAASFTNIRNGLYAFYVAAIDTSGNLSEDTECIYFCANKYIPSTYISEVIASTDDFGDSTFEINGSGFTYDGKITEIYLFKDSVKNPEYTFRLSNNDYRIASNYRIDSLNISLMKSGIYGIALRHSDRGLYVSNSEKISIEEYGTVKSKIAFIAKPIWKFFSQTGNRGISITKVIIFMILLFALIASVVSARLLASSVKETIKVKNEVRTLIEGGVMTEEKKSRILLYNKNGRSLKSKLILKTTILIASLDILTFVLLGIFMISSQSKTLSEGLLERTNVMLNSISRTSKIYLPVVRKDDALSILDLNDMILQANALSELKSATLTGFTTDQSGNHLNLVWATTDEDIASKISTPSFIAGESTLLKSREADILEEFLEINQTASEKTEALTEKINSLMQETIALSGKTDHESDLKRERLLFERNELLSKLNTKLDEIAVESITSFPLFNKSDISSDNTTYTFYKPVLYRQEGKSSYVHGVIMLTISTESLIEEIRTMKFIIIRSSILLLILILAIAFFTTYRFATRIVQPINTLVSHVAMIRDTSDKELLDGKNVVIKTNDEIKMLGDTVNEMTQALVQAAVQAKDLTFGKEIQAKFLPLTQNEKGNAGTTGSLKTPGADFFSYYVGADDLSGDYFDYLQIDKNHFAIIKCDISGHGLPAALIMVEVATLFLNYFSHWNMSDPEQGKNLAPVVGRINDLLESRGFKGRFAAFTLCILNTETGECSFCNAGDSVVQVYDGELKKKKTLTLSQSPAAGMFPTDMIQMNGGFKVSPLTLKKDDVLFLYTDGIEEAKRTCTHFSGDSQNPETEEFSPERVTEIIENVYSRGTFTLKKNIEGKITDLHFDFSTCTSSSEDAVMALVSIEKVFRLYKADTPSQTDHVKVDRTIEAFLKEHFLEYNLYFASPDEKLSDSSYAYFNGVLEDGQYDDITIIAIKKL